MKTFDEVLDQFSPEDGRLVFRFGPDVTVPVEGRNEPVDVPQYQLELEPIVGGGYLIALYENDPHEPWPALLLPDKVPVRPILRESRGIAGEPTFQALYEQWLRERFRGGYVYGIDAFAGGYEAGLAVAAACSGLTAPAEQPDPEQSEA